MKSFVIFICLQGFVLTLFGQNDYLLLTKPHRHEIKISEGSKVKIKLILSDIGTAKGKMKLPAASSGVSKYQPHKSNLAASCGELTPKEIRNLK